MCRQYYDSLPGKFSLVMTTGLLVVMISVWSVFLTVYKADNIF